MNWITDKVLPKFKALVKKENSEEVLWIKCKSCEQMIFYKEHDSNLNVCKSCGYHDFMKIENRTKMKKWTELFFVLRWQDTEMLNRPFMKIKK